MFTLSGQIFLKILVKIPMKKEFILVYFNYYYFSLLAIFILVYFSYYFNILSYQNTTITFKLEW